jgi:hypothetical protein
LDLAIPAMVVTLSSLLVPQLQNQKPVAKSLSLVVWGTTKPAVTVDQLYLWAEKERGPKVQTLAVLCL